MVKQKNKKKILIIGSNSFSANSFINLALKENFKVFAISRSKISSSKYLTYDKNNKKFNFFKLDINRNFKKILLLINKVKPRYIINYASQSMVGESWNSPIDWYRTNSLGLIKLYNHISNLEFTTRLVHISTPEVYGNIRKETKENKNYNPTTPYAASRITAEHFLDLLSTQNKINYCSVRASNVYGEHQKLYRIIPKTIFSILSKSKLTLHGGGQSKRNFIHIDDVSSAIYSVMIKGKRGNCYHISGKDLISIKNLVQKICKKMNYQFKDLIRNSSERKGKDKYYSLSSAKIKKQLNWQQKISLDNGIEKCINWIKKNKNYYKKNDLVYVHKK